MRVQLTAWWKMETDSLTVTVHTHRWRIKRESTLLQKYVMVPSSCLTCGSCFCWLGFFPHSEHRFPAPSSKEGCRKPVLGVWVLSYHPTPPTPQPSAYILDTTVSMSMAIPFQLPHSIPRTHCRSWTTIVRIHLHMMMMWGFMSSDVGLIYTWLTYLHLLFSPYRQQLRPCV